jgi:hypothetical protein
VSKLFVTKAYSQDGFEKNQRLAFVAGKTVNPERVKARYGEVYRRTSAAGFDSAPYSEAEDKTKAAKKGM